MSRLDLATQETRAALRVLSKHARERLCERHRGLRASGTPT
jgi:hypothetical protein